MSGFYRNNVASETLLQYPETRRIREISTLAYLASPRSCMSLAEFLNEAFSYFLFASYRQR